MYTNFKKSAEYYDISDNFSLNFKDSQSQLNKQTSIQSQSQDTQFKNILTQLKNNSESTQGSEQIVERSSFNCMSTLEINEDEQELLFFNGNDQKFSFEKQDLETPKKRNSQQQNFIADYFFDIEDRINCWLDSQGIKQVSPLDKKDEYFEQKKKIISTQVLQSQNDLNEESNQTPSAKNLRKQSLLERRKLNKIIGPKSCYELDYINCSLPKQENYMSIFTASDFTL
ncbi:hypothetical protein TTHERM_00392630 (macronuclear) [Tetrahymena thermophila SB210]|uniref:Uncharacterized protein n=1 Tax=Tetrahymena thermophila (strain SB210) TaxID=312017 RepID=Q233I6_TETTS|nr:hypothetical protein TTHERM_00392630 [Tetrahymena thermophila SB210]EAR91594.3 hypothetical protein TTHERM_00392630 [Tetrahymena thermophila SB210]|eukprot:XP_001011839.3 hypothetical protein TTHERM_00392630 [Tetrahymena thermophila SB210]